jgi:hypothetical protein
MSHEQFLNDEGGLNGLAKADIVGDEEIDTGHVNRADNGVKLVALNRNAAAKWRLKKAAISVRCGTPSDRIKKGIKPVS